MIRKIKEYIYMKILLWYTKRFLYCVNRVGICNTNQNFRHVSFWKNRAYKYQEKMFNMINILCEEIVL